MSAPAASHRVATSEWYTPRDIVAAARSWLGEIDLDPASCEAAQVVVGASLWHCSGTDGLSKTWAGRVFCNPPSPPRPWGERLASAMNTGAVERAVFVGYSIETLSQYQNWRGFRPSIVCVPRTRPHYLRRVGDVRLGLAKALAQPGTTTAARAERLLAKMAHLLDDEIVEGDAPAHASAIFGLGDPAGFAACFAPIGCCFCPEHGTAGPCPYCAGTGEAYDPMTGEGPACPACAQAEAA